MRRRVYVLIFLALVSAMSAARAHADESMTALVRLNVRDAPGLDSTVLDTLHVGERVRVTQCRGEWCQIVHVGINGWVFSPYLKSATFYQAWRATSGALPATLDDNTAGTIPVGVNLDLSPRRNCPPNRPFC